MSTEIVYRFKARNSEGHPQQGAVNADNRAQALGKLRKMGFTSVVMSPSLGETLRHNISPGFNPRELARLYETLGKRLLDGRPLAQGLIDAQEFLMDSRLRNAAAAMAQAVSDGQNEYQAMLTAGFPSRDAMIVRSTLDAGAVGRSFLSLAEEIRRNYDLRQSIRATLRMPAIMLVAMIFFIYGALVFMAPLTIKFLKSTGLKIKLNPLIQSYFDFAQFFNENLAVGTVIYFSVPVAAVFFLRSRIARLLMSRIRVLELLSQKSDHAVLWRSFSLLYGASVPMRESTKILADAASREDSRDSFLRMGRLIDEGVDVSEAVQRAGFPRYVVNGVRAAESSGKILDGLEALVRQLDEDVRVTIDLLKTFVQTASPLVMGIGILILFVLSYYPMVAAVLSNV